MLIPSRREFLKKSLLTGGVLAIASQGLFADTTPLEILKVVQVDLFPQDMIENANAYAYITLILNHSRITQDNKQFLLNGTSWLDEEARNKHKKDYIQLNPNERQEVLKSIALESWGEDWIKTVLRYIMEATLGDPVYGINKKESGWKWLSFEPGLPQPKKAFL